MLRQANLSLSTPRTKPEYPIPNMTTARWRCCLCKWVNYRVDGKRCVDCGHEDRARCTGGFSRFSLTATIPHMPSPQACGNDMADASWTQIGNDRPAIPETDAHRFYWECCDCGVVNWFINGTGYCRNCDHEKCSDCYVGVVPAEANQGFRPLPHAELLGLNFVGTFRTILTNHHHRDTDRDSMDPIAQALAQHCCTRQRAGPLISIL